MQITPIINQEENVGIVVKLDIIGMNAQNHQENRKKEEEEQMVQYQRNH